MRRTAIFRWSSTGMAASAWLVAQSGNLLACPNCKFALETDTSGQSRAYMLSIIFMLTVIMSLFGGMCLLLWRLSYQEARALTEAGYDHVLHNAVNAR